MDYSTNRKTSHYYYNIPTFRRHLHKSCLLSYTGRRDDDDGNDAVYPYVWSRLKQLILHVQRTQQKQLQQR